MHCLLASVVNIHLQTNGNTINYERAVLSKTSLVQAEIYIGKKLGFRFLALYYTMKAFLISQTLIKPDTNEYHTMKAFLDSQKLINMLHQHICVQGQGVYHRWALSAKLIRVDTSTSRNALAVKGESGLIRVWLQVQSTPHSVPIACGITL